MNMNLETRIEKPLNVALNALNSEQLISSPFGEIDDNTSSWHQMRLAEMNGVDYLFVPHAVFEYLNSKASIQAFLIKSQLLFTTNLERVSLICFSNNLNPKFTRFSIEWKNEKISAFSTQNLEFSPQLEFIEMLFDHSEDLIIS